MRRFQNSDGKTVLLGMVKAIQDNKAYLGEVDGLIGDGDHGMNMNKGFTAFENRFRDVDITFTKGLDELGTILLSEIGGSMGPIYGTIFMDAAEAGSDFDEIGVMELSQMLRAGLEGLHGIVEARLGDKTLVDVLTPAVEVMENSDLSLAETLINMKSVAEKGKESTKDMVAKFGRSSRLGERSRGVFDAGAVSCCIILNAIADGILEHIQQRDNMKIAIGCDEAAYALKAEIMKHLDQKEDITYVDFGADAGELILYPDLAYKVAGEIAAGRFHRGILFCGTGIGMAICANKVAGIRAAVCHDPFSAERARKSNNAQILCMGERVIGVELAKYLVDIWLACDFAGGGSTAKVERINELEKAQR